MSGSKPVLKVSITPKKFYAAWGVGVERVEGEVGVEDRLPRKKLSLTVLRIYLTALATTAYFPKFVLPFL